MTLSGSRLDGRYLVIDRIGPTGRPGVGEVWRAVDQWDAPVAVRVLDLTPGLGADAEQRFLHARGLLTGINHPNVVRVRDLLVLNGTRLAIVTDLAGGGDLAAMLDPETLPPVDVAAVGGQVAYGLGALHARGLTHQGVRPSTVMLHEVDGLLSARVSDFAVALLGAYGLIRPPAESLPQNLPYQAPELAAGAVPTPRSDLYALGIMLYELSTGVRPFDGVAPADLVHAHANLAPGRPAGVPDLLWDQISVLLAKDPLRRPDDANQVAARLAFIRERVAGLPAARRLAAPPPPLRPAAAQVSRVVPPAPVPTAQHRPPRPKDSRRGVWLALAALVVVVAVVGWLLLGSRDAPTVTPSASRPTTAQVTDAPSTTVATTTRTSTLAPTTSLPAFPAGVSQCSESIGVNRNTSCEFAANVAAAWSSTSRTGTTTVRAISPVTNQTYTMTCVAGPVTVCTGGNNAAVYIR
ncbi:serine/threonine protein kinase [Tessaracoccus sp. SD287]|uniref:serine/threonine-protein kinase n=1 Tax=Tessaracoccus sp. SD287 TaxID=2782008 RepID=UPI001A977FBA|nr:serine/threonine-protein kinase [Tessaracoccus sp. SD287]MBO1030660.1 serine/threonine protein kinase [Tessaracoccus sp. SD287]